jgi:DNA invertase Pin-like site-specific DNA recombinase
VARSIDPPTVDEFTLHILTVVVQQEVSASFSRTRDTLVAKKTRGFTLGTPANLTDEAKLKGLAARQANAQTNVNIPTSGAAGGAVAGQRRESAGYCRATQSVGLHDPAWESFSHHGCPAPTGL